LRVQQVILSGGGKHRRPILCLRGRWLQATSRVVGDGARTLAPAKTSASAWGYPARERKTRVQASWIWPDFDIQGNDYDQPAVPCQLGGAGGAGIGHD